MTAVEKVTSRDGTSIAFERVGTGPALVLVDAAGCFRGFGPMAPLAAELASRFTVFRYDRRGRGDSSDTLPYVVDREIEDLGAVIDAAGGSAYVYGFSSGAVLALHAAAHRLTIPKLALLEPPVILDDQEQSGPDLGADVAKLVVTGRRGDAVEHFNTSIGVPPAMIAGWRAAPFWPALEALAHTLVYDLIITTSLPKNRLSGIATPTLVINSEASDDRLQAWARGVADALPNARHVSLKGEWHGPALEHLAPALTEFFNGATR